MKLHFAAITAVLFSVSVVTASAQLSSPQNQADYIIIYPAGFKTTLEPYIQWRESQNIKIITADIQEIYKEFPAERGQESVREFISYALQNWEKPAPKYVLLAGGVEFIPSYRVLSEFAGNPNYHEDSVSLDEVFSINKFETDKFPDIAIGRFPARNIDELQNMLDKTLLVENSVKRKQYKHDMTLVTDKQDSEPFQYSAEDIANATHRSKFSLKRISADENSKFYGTITDLIEVINNGSMFLSYHGHGSPTLWSIYNILEVDDVSRFENNGLPFFYTAVACSQTFDDINTTEITEAFMSKRDGGAVATFATAGLNFLSESSGFLSSFYEELFKNPDEMVGKVILKVKQERPGNMSTERYTLLGDPLLKLPLDITSGVGNFPIAEDGELAISPNPAASFVNVSYSLKTSAHVQIRLIDALGREVMAMNEGTRDSGNNSVQIVTGNLLNGVYSLVLESADGKIVKQLVVMR